MQYNRQYFHILLLTVVKVCNCQFEEWSFTDPRDDMFYYSRLFDSTRKTAIGSKSFQLPGMQTSQTYQRPIIIVNTKGFPDHRDANSDNDQGSRESEDEERQDQKNSQKKKVDQEISAYVPTAFVIDGDRQRETNQEKEKYGIVMVAPKQPENYAMLNYDGREEIIEKDNVYFQDPRIYEAYKSEDPQFTEIVPDDGSNAKSKLTLLFLGYEKF